MHTFFDGPDMFQLPYTKLLTALKSHPNLARIQNADGDTYLHYAAKFGHKNIKEFAESLDPSLAEIRNENGQTYLDLFPKKSVEELKISLDEVLDERRREL